MGYCECAIRKYVSSNARSSSKLSSDTSDLRRPAFSADERGEATLLGGGGIAVIGVRTDMWNPIGDWLRSGGGGGGPIV